MPAIRGEDKVTSGGPARVEEQLAVGARVRVYPGSANEDIGWVVDDLGEMLAIDVRVDVHQLAKAARRWAVVLDGDVLVFVDSDQLSTH